MTRLDGLVLGSGGNLEMAEVGVEKSASQCELLNVGVTQSRDQEELSWRLCAAHRDMEDSQTALPIHEVRKAYANVVDTELDTKSAELEGK